MARAPARPSRRHAERGGRVAPWICEARRSDIRDPGVPVRLRPRVLPRLRDAGDPAGLLGVLALVLPGVSLERRGREPKEHQLRDARAALEPVAALVQHRQEPFAAPRIARVPHPPWIATPERSRL